MVGDNNPNDKGKLSVLVLSLFFVAEIEPTEHQEMVVHDVNIEDMMKVNHQF